MFSPRFPSDLLEDVIPLVERTYRVKQGAQHRAIAGLSMGGGQALTIGLANPRLFGYVLGYSAAVGGQFGNIDETLFDSPRPPRPPTQFRLVWVGCGRQDFLFNNNKQFVDALTSRGVKVTYRETEGATYGASGVTTCTRRCRCCFDVDASERDAPSRVSRLHPKLPQTTRHTMSLHGLWPPCSM